MKIEIKSSSCQVCVKRFNCLLLKLCGNLPGVCERFKEDKRELSKSKSDSSRPGVRKQ